MPEVLNKQKQTNKKPSKYSGVEKTCDMWYREVGMKTASQSGMRPQIPMLRSWHYILSLSNQMSF